MKYNHEIIFENETDHKELVEQHKKMIVDCVKQIAKTNFDFDIKLRIKIRDIEERENFVNKEVDAGYMRIEKDKSWTLCIGINSLERIEHDKGLDLDKVIYHEMAHIYDLYHIRHNKFYRLNPGFTTQKRHVDYAIHVGWVFWTEFWAYYQMFVYLPFLKEYPTYFQLVKGYEKICKQYDKIKPFVFANDKSVQGECEDHIEKIEAFTYTVAKYLAGSLEGKKRYHKVLETKQNKKYMNAIDKITIKLAMLSTRMFVNPYGKGTARKLFDIGTYILENIYAKFLIFPKKKNGHIVLAYCT